MSNRPLLFGALILLLGATAAPAQNLLTNPGFEAGLSGWGSFGNAFGESVNPPQFVPRTGTGLASLFGQFNGTFNVSGLFQQFSASPGDVFEMDAWARHNTVDALSGGGAPTDNWVVMKIAFFDSGANEIGASERTILDGTFATGVWHDPAPIQGTAPTGTSFVQALLLYLQPGFDAGAGHVDDVEFRQVGTPQPTSYVPAVGLPSRIDSDGTLQVREVRLDGTLAPWSDFEIRGVDMGWTPIGGSPGNAASPFVNPDFIPVLDKMKDLGANLLRFYFLPPGVTSPEYQATRDTLDICYLMGLKVLVGLQPELIGSPTGQALLTQAVGAYGDHPAVLGFSIGNEWNLTLFGAPLNAKAAEVEALATQLKTLDPDRVVISSLACGPDNDIFRPIGTAATPAADIVALTPSVDFYGMNLYRTETFHPFFHLWQEATGGKPYAIFEYGSDSWDNDLATIDHGPRVTDILRHIDDSRRMSSGPVRDQAYNGFVMFAAVDEWWKNNAPGNSPFVQEPDGFFTSPFLQPTSNPAGGLLFRADLDGHRSEEHFGLLRLPGLSEKPEFGAVRSRYRNTALPFSGTHLEVVSSGFVGPAGGLDNGYWALRYNGNAVYFEEGGAGSRGLNIVIFDRRTGTVEEMVNFDTYGALEAGGGGILSAATAYVNALPSGRLVAMAVADTFTHFSGNSGPYVALVSAIQARTGATSISASMPFRAGWALLGVVDAAAPLAEAGPSVGVELAAGAGIAYDLDGDGVDDDVDSDLDNDGKSNAWEVARGTDPISPASRLLRIHFELDPVTRLLSLGIDPGDASGTLFDIDFASVQLELITPLKGNLNSLLQTNLFGINITPEGGFVMTTVAPIAPLSGFRMGFRFLDVQGHAYSEIVLLD